MKNIWEHCLENSKANIHVMVFNGAEELENQSRQAAGESLWQDMLS